MSVDGPADAFIVIVRDDLRADAGCGGAARAAKMGLDDDAAG